MTLNGQNVEKRLLAHNFFPRVAKRGDEFPPCFVSTDFTPKLASALVRRKKRSDGYGAISLRSARHDLAPRNLEIIHPRAFADIARLLKTHWEEWKDVISNESSAIRVSDHADGRVFSMVTTNEIDDLFFPGGRFLAKVDITNFYGSIYTHSIPWSIHGLSQAKANQGDKSDWANELDLVLRHSRRKETIGLPAGPGTSGIASEILLRRVDHSLRNRGFRFLRYIDDYYYVGTSLDDAENFISKLNDELAVLKLSINPRKTSIKELPAPMKVSWMRELRASLRGRANSGRLSDTIDHALDALEQQEDGALRFALVSIEAKIGKTNMDDRQVEVIVDRLLSIGYLRPVVVGTACRLLNGLGAKAVKSRKEVLNRMLCEHARIRRTDATTWILYTMLAHRVAVGNDAVKAVMDSKDCLALVLLSASRKYTKGVLEFLVNLESEDPPDYRRDEYWLLYYQLALKSCRPKMTPQTYYHEFEPLLDAKVSFVDLAAKNPYLPVHGTNARSSHGNRRFGRGQGISGYSTRQSKGGYANGGSETYGDS